jgi:predicted  nucleic acid-binding Zn-ribbon protein
MEKSIKEKLEALVELQVVDTYLNKIIQLRGNLPFEVQELEDEIMSIDLKIQDIQSKIDANKKNISGLKISIKEQEDLIKKYEEQQMLIKNNREYEAILKEIELSNLEIQAFKRKIAIAEKQNSEYKELLDVFTEKKQSKLHDLEIKQKELKEIVALTEKEEKELGEVRNKLVQNVDARLLASYERIKRNMRNRLAVVGTEREACGGCFAVVPPQRINEIKQIKKIIVCENCGRILVDNEMITKAKEKLNLKDVTEELYF